jgi:hypothetical protein
VKRNKSDRISATSASLDHDMAQIRVHLERVNKSYVEPNIHRLVDELVLGYERIERAYAQWARAKAARTHQAGHLYQPPLRMVVAYGSGARLPLGTRQACRTGLLPCCGGHAASGRLSWKTRRRML